MAVIVYYAVHLIWSGGFMGVGRENDLQEKMV